MARRSKRPGVRGKRRREGSRAGFVLRGIRFPLELDRRLNRAMDATGSNRSEIVREAVARHLDRIEKRLGTRFEGDDHGRR